MDLYFSPTGDSDFNNSANWYEDTDYTLPHYAIPTTGDNAFVLAGAMAGIVASGTFGGDTLTIAGEVSLSNSSTYEFNGRPLTIQSGGYFNVDADTILNSAATVVIDSGGYIQNYGTFNLVSVSVTNNGTFASHNVFDNSGSGAFINNGTCSNGTSFTAGTFENNGNLVNNGILVAAGGDLTNLGTITNNSTFQVNSPRAFINDGTFTNNGLFSEQAGCTFSGSGTWSRSAGSIDLSTMTAGTNVTLPSGGGAVNWW